MSATASQTPILQRGSWTPWGPADEVWFQPDTGIVHVDTPDHGGFFVPPALNEQVPAYVKASTWNSSQGTRGWYEEDVDWAWVALCFPEAFERRQIVRALGILRHCRRPLLDKFVSERAGGDEQLIVQKGRTS